MSGAKRFIHNFGYSNFFAGVDAGNLTMLNGYNVGVGFLALQGNTNGQSNTAVGAVALQSNTDGKLNTAVGTIALWFNTKGDANTAVGGGALSNNTIGNQNTAVGLSSLGLNNTGSNNTAVGMSSLQNNSAGTDNIALGYSAGKNLLSGSNNIYIGNSGPASESNTIRIGTDGTHTQTFIAGISPGLGGCDVYITSSDQLIRKCSSSRFKELIEDMGAASEILYRLRPVSFLYKPEFGGRSDQTQFGLIAEDVAKVAPELVDYDDQGQPYTVNYQFLAPMLLNELQRKEVEFIEMRARLEVLEKLIKELKETMSKQ